jgi:hypothetical protein
LVKHRITLKERQRTKEKKDLGADGCTYLLTNVGRLAPAKAGQICDDGLLKWGLADGRYLWIRQELRRWRTIEVRGAGEARVVAHLAELNTLLDVDGQHAANEVRDVLVHILGDCKITLGNRSEEQRDVVVVEGQRAGSKDMGENDSWLAK